MEQRATVTIPAVSMGDSNPVSSEACGLSVGSNAVTATSESAPHEVERVVIHALQHHPSLKFTRLTVHQWSRDSICIEGVLESNEEDVNLSDVVRGVHDFKEIIDRVVPPKSSVKVPKKG